MRDLLARIFHSHAETRGDSAFREAMRASADLLRNMGHASASTSAARAIIADVWAQSDNTPFLTTVYESVQEAKSGPEQNILSARSSIR